MDLPLDLLLYGVTCVDLLNHSITLFLTGFKFILGTFWIMNMIFGAAKTAKGVVDSVSDNIVPDAKPSGA